VLIGEAFDRKMLQRRTASLSVIGSLHRQHDAAGYMVIEVVADPGRIGDDGDTMRFQERRRAEPRKLQQLRAN
jgi:hypothetical protein